MLNYAEQALYDHCYREIREAIDNFGRYTYEDKGVGEVILVTPMINRFKAVPSASAAKVLLALHERRDHDDLFHQFARDLLSYMEDWDGLFEEPGITDIEY
jgi:hypothetical protein